MNNGNKIKRFRCNCATALVPFRRQHTKFANIFHVTLFYWEKSFRLKTLVKWQHANFVTSETSSAGIADLRDDEKIFSNPFLHFRDSADTNIDWHLASWRWSGGRRSTQDPHQEFLRSLDRTRSQNTRTNYYVHILSNLALHIEGVSLTRFHYACEHSERVLF